MSDLRTTRDDVDEMIRMAAYPHAALIEAVIEHIQSAWIATGHHTWGDRYERVWPIGSIEYHLQAAERAATVLSRSVTEDGDA